MPQTNIGISIPSKFQAISRIQSVEMRTRLVQIISAIDEILEETRSITFDKKNSDLLTRFYTYLEDSCQSISRLNRRGHWLTVYGTVALTRMYSERNKVIKFSEEYTNHEHEELMEKVSILVREVGEMQSKVEGLNSDDISLIDQSLDHLIKTAKSIKPVTGAAYYRAITPSIAHTASVYKAMNEGKVLMLSNDFTATLFRDISMLSTKISTYNIRKRFES